MSKQTHDIQLTAEFPVKPQVIYEAWLDSEGHTRMTGGGAECSNEINAPFSAWDGYISGRNLILERDRRIVQSWRTSEFSETDDDSELQIELKETERGCLLTLVHRNIPEGQPDYEQGWIDHYFDPMKEYFGGT